ncbi:MAG: class I SAM-dependent methyltransferase [Victivallales bacterium]|nr:class I SAM-dependent methyltransferase [Victivallales bacterium]
MATVCDHYKTLLSDIYIWMMGGFENTIKRNSDFFTRLEILPARSGIAVDLGAGCGFQSIPLAKTGFSVIAIDTDNGLLQELNRNKNTLPIKTVNDDLYKFDQYINSKAELIVCMTDTILHLESCERVETLLKKIADNLEPEGKFILSFRDLSHALTECDRFIPVKSDENTIMTCFLEYETETVKVHDLVYRKNGGTWDFHKSFYRKLRLSNTWFEQKLTSAGFRNVNLQLENGMTVIVAVK